jgi:hypothetical protein
VTTAADRLLVDLARETAVEVARLACERELARVNERDHLQPSCTRAARTVGSSLPRDLIVSTSLGFKSPLWPRLGRVDLAFVSGEETPVAVELKSGAGRDALAACAWDAVKLAFMLRHQQVSAAYLLAATPASDWALGLRGTEFFGASSFHTQALREPYLDWWRPGNAMAIPRAANFRRHSRRDRLLVCRSRLARPSGLSQWRQLRLIAAGGSSGSLRWKTVDLGAYLRSWLCVTRPRHYGAD